MAALPSTAPMLSTPDTHIFNETPTPLVHAPKNRLSDEQLEIRYEIDRTLAEIKKYRWNRIALQFPDEMLPDSARVYQRLAQGLNSAKTLMGIPNEPKTSVDGSEAGELSERVESISIEDQKPVKITILADTSYGSCCVDEIAAEHVDADAVVHYGRACLSPTARLPVLHIFTKRGLDYASVVRAFTELFEDRASKIILTADVTYANHIEPLHALLVDLGYSNVFPATIVRDPSSPIPNRTVPESVGAHATELQNYKVFHISDPPTSLLLTLSSRVQSIHTYATDSSLSNTTLATTLTSTQALLRRRYALVTSLSTVSTWGILINTLSVKNYLSIVEHVKKQIADAGRKSYLFVVGKLNAAKVANFSEVGGWVVIGCWESSLIDSKDFYRPVVTPFELGLALQRDTERRWTGQWSGDFQPLLLDADRDEERERDGGTEIHEASAGNTEGESLSSDEESAPPEFDLRTGRYVSQSRPLAISQRSERSGRLLPQSNALSKRANGDVVAVNGVTSPAADFLRSKRTWQGLGSDFEVRYEDDEEAGESVQEGRSGIARGYTVGESHRT